MKVVADNEVTRIYPFITPDGEPGISPEYIKVYPGGAIRHVRPHRAVMSADNVRLLAKALEYAAGLAEAGRGVPIFTFRGKIYVRPMGRGICLYDEQGEELGKQLEEALPSELNGYAEVAVWEEKPE